MDIGLGYAFGAIALLAAVAMLVTAHLAALNGSESLQFLSAVSIAIALLAGGVAIAAVHLFER